MKTKKYKMGPATRLQIGALVLEGALEVDTTLVKPHLHGFDVVNHRYLGAQGKVATLEELLREIQAQLAQRNIVQDEAMEALACVLATDGQPRTNPFDAYGAEAPSLLKALPFTEKAAAIAQLIAAVKRSKTVGQASRAAAQVVQKAARAMAAGLAQAENVKTRLDNARRRRDTIGERWDKAFRALKHRTVSAADDGGTDLHAALFGRLVQPKRKKKTAAPVTPPATPPVTPAAAPGTPDTTVS